MSTGAIIAIVVIAVIILILLLVLLPKMRKQAAEKKAENERRERERRLEAERQEKAQEHRSEADQKRHQAELAEAEAKRSRAEADINAKRAELHEGGLADDELPSGSASPNGRVEDRQFRPDDGDRDHDSRDLDSGRTRGGGAVAEDDDSGRDRGVRDLGGGGRAHEPAGDDRAPSSEYERGLQDGERLPDGEQESSGGRTMRPEDHNEVDEGRPGPLR